MFAFDEALPWLSYVREHGVQQFVAMFHDNKALTSDELLWGDEIEYHLVRLDEKQKTAKVALRAEEVLEVLRQKEHQFGRRDGFGEACSWHPEYGAWMVEGTPRVPYGGRVEHNMRLRRKRLAAVLRPDERAITMPAFPTLGVGDFAEPAAAAGHDATSRLAALPRTLLGPLSDPSRRQRRDAYPNPSPTSTAPKPIPYLHSTQTHPLPPQYPNPSPTSTVPKPILPCRAGIEMDAMAYGMGCCCLQARDIDESRHLYDHLAVLAPVMLALAAAFAVSGRLADTDVRWATVAASVDDRTPFERGLAPLAGGGVAPLPKSRYESISVYLANRCMKRYNDLDAPVDGPSLERLLEGGVDEDLARHVAHLFVRDPLVIMKSRLRLDDATETDHFENLQGTNWRRRRTACVPQVGWRVEFRSMEVQLTDFENAAFTTFVVLVSRVILAFDLNLYLPLTKVDENMRRAHLRDAVLQQRFWFRKHM
ncbi:gamma-glutamylcysteine synthetase, partial [Emiliania huxleyi CCMP1516]|uniref:Glutamate--cysteine ligase n=2 Tax=Emiliania huxleyi TaxID=2903 RepID=A0A0D3JHQ4_EMIH1